MRRERAPRGGTNIRLGAAATAALLAASGCAGATAEREYGAQLRAYRQLDSRPGDDGASDAAVFAGAAAMDRGALIEAVLARNPSIEAARRAWGAALEEVPQATSLDDPMIRYALAPLSIASDEVPFGHEVELSQRLPFPGKRRLAGAVAVAEAEAARSDLAAVRLELALMASNLFDDHYVAGRALAINAEHQVLLRQLQGSAEARYVAGRAAQQDPLQAEVELAQLERERLVLETDVAVLRAQLNGLLHREVTAALPPPPDELPADPTPIPPLGELVDAALANRPELDATRARVRAAHTAVDLAGRDFYPDLEVMGSYSSMFGMAEHQWMVGIGLNLPIWRGRRRAAERAAEARTGRLSSELLGRIDDVRVEVERARRRLAEAMQVARLYETRLVPAARDQVAAAMAGFPAGTTSFTAVIEAERNQRSVKLQYETTRAEVYRRRAALDRAVGRIPGSTDGGER